MARKKTGERQTIDKNTGEPGGLENTPNVHADRSSIAIGSISIGRDLSGSFTIGYTAEQVSQLLTQFTTNYQRKPFDGRCPYKGLDVFEEEDAEFFFGRERLVEDLVRRVKESRTVFITGPSGSGKSSLVRAGLIHALKQGAIKGSDRWLYEIMKPGWEPLKDLALVFSRLKGPDLADYLQAHANETDILNTCAESVLSGRKDQRLVLFVDQFEEVFTQTSQETERRTFLDMLAHAGALETGRVIVLFAMRSDFVSNCAAYPAINELLSRQFRQIGAMQPHELVSAIALPAIHVGLPIEDELIARIINDMKGEPGALPLMQFALKELFEAGKKEGGLVALTLKDYIAREGIQKMLARHADDTVDAFRDDQRELARSIFSRLIEIEQGRQTTRRMAFFEELIPANATREDVLIVVQKLADARLLTTDEQDSSKYTITHEALIDAWPWLKKVANEYREVIALQNEIDADAREWNKHQRERSYLYRGVRLANVREQLETKKLILTSTANEFLQAGIKNYDDEIETLNREQTRRRRLQTRIITGLIGVIAIILFLLNFVLNQLNISHALQLSAQAQVAFAEQNYNLAALYAYQANQMHANESADEILDQLPYQNFGFGRALLGHTQEVTGVAWSTDGRLASASQGGTIIVWNLETDQPAHRLVRGSLALSSTVAWSNDGRLASAGYTDGTVIIWDLVRGQPAQTLKTNTLIVSSLAWSPDGRLAAANGDGDIIVWDLSTGQPAQTLTGNKELVRSLAWSADGHLASAGTSAIIWDLSTGQPAQTFEAKETLATSGMDFIQHVAWSADGNYLAYVSTDGSMTIWDLVTGQPAQTIKTKFYPTSVAWSADGRLATGTSKGAVVVWDLSTGQPAQTLYGHQDWVWNIAWSTDGRLASASKDNTVIVWDLKQEPPAQVFTYADSITSEAWSSDGRLASGSGDGSIVVSDRSGQPIRILKGHKEGVTGVAWSFDDRLASSSYDGTVMVWDTSTGQPIQTLKGHGDEVTGVAWSTDGQLASGAKNGTVILWDLATGQPKQTLTGYLSEVTSLAWSSDGRLAFAGQIQPDRGEGAILIWDSAAGRLAQTLKENVAGVTSVAWSADDRLASGGAYAQIIIWDLDTGRQAQTLKNNQRVDSIAWSSDGYLASASRGDDGTVTIWDLAVGQPTQTLKGYPQGVSSVAWSRDGRLAIGSNNGTNIARADLLRTPLCQWLFRNMTSDEWASYKGVLYTYQPACPNLPSPSLGMLYTWKGRAILLGILILMFALPMAVLRLIAAARRLLSRRTRKTQFV